jgi:hypothetical protein
MIKRAVRLAWAEVLIAAVAFSAPSQAGYAMGRLLE